MEEVNNSIKRIHTNAELFNLEHGGKTTRDIIVAVA